MENYTLAITIEAEAEKAVEAFENSTTAMERMLAQLKSVQSLFYGLETALEKLSGAFSQEFVEIEALFSTLLEKAESWGAGLVKQLMEGISSAWGSLIEYLAGLLNQLSGLFNKSPAEYGPLREVSQWGENFWFEFIRGSEQAVPFVQSHIIGALRSIEPIININNNSSSIQFMLDRQPITDKRIFITINSGIESETTNLRIRELIAEIRREILDGN